MICPPNDNTRKEDKQEFCKIVNDSKNIRIMGDVNDCVGVEEYGKRGNEDIEDNGRRLIDGYMHTK